MLTRQWIIDQLNSFIAFIMEMLLGYVTPQMFGAKGDGIADDTAAVRSAIRHGGIVFFPEGTYRVEVAQVYLSPTKDLFLKGNNAKIQFFVGNNTDIRNVCALTSGTGCKNISIEGIDFSLDINEEISISNEIQLLHLIGQFEEIHLNNIKVHSGGIGSALPKTDCLWIEAGAKVVEITDCTVENFTNTVVGGCIWINPQYKLNNVMTYTDLDNVIIRNCVIRSTNHDEAVAVFIREDDTINKGLHNVVIDSNSIEHKNWNGECSPTANLVCVYSKGGELNVNGIISNNTIVTNKAKSVGLIKNMYCDSCIIENNTIEINGVGKRDNDPTSDYPNCPVINNISGNTVFRNNTVKFNVASNLLLLTSDQGNIEFSNNIITSLSNVNLSDDDTGLGTGIKKSTVFKGNTINLNGESGSNKLLVSSKRLSEVHRVTRVLNNFINGIFNIDSQFAHAPIEVIGNTLGYIDNAKVNYYYQFKGGESLIWENNKNIALYCSDSNLVTKLTNFKYLGMKNGLNLVGGYEPSHFFDSSEITYHDGYTDAVLSASDDIDFESEVGINVN